MNTDNLLLATEILNDINKNSNENQKGGFVFSLIVVFVLGLLSI